jgi:hypothetical protein
VQNFREKREKYDLKGNILWKYYSRFSEKKSPNFEESISFENFRHIWTLLFSLVVIIFKLPIFYCLDSINW